MGNKPRKITTNWCEFHANQLKELPNNWQTNWKQISSNLQGCGEMKTRPPEACENAENVRESEKNDTIKHNTYAGSSPATPSKQK